MFKSEKTSSCPDPSFEEAASATKPPMNGLSNGANKTGDSCNDGLQADHLNECTQLLGRFVDWFLQRPDILRASSYYRNRLAAEIRLYILTQTIQCTDSKDLLVRENTEQSTAVFDTAGKGFLDWVYGAAAFSTGIPHSLALMACHRSEEIGNPNVNNADCFPSAEETYYAQALAQHTFAMYRFMNDVGGILRDRSDKALNAVDFLESHHDGNKRFDEGLTDELLRLARFEQEAMTRCLKKLKECCGVDKRKRRTVELMDMLCKISLCAAQI